MRSTTSILRILLVGVFLLIPTTRAFALEISYPSFLPLHEGIKINELVLVIFRASIILAGVTAFLSLIYVGFQYIVSGDSAGQRKAARQRLTSVVMGIAILLSSIILLNFLNPNLVTLPELKTITLNIPSSPFPALPEAGFIAGGSYQVVSFERSVNTAADITEELSGGLAPTLGDILELSSQCSAALCKGGQTTYSALVGYESRNCTTEQSCSGDGEDQTCTDTEVCDSYPICRNAQCSADLCSGDPFPQRNELAPLTKEALTRLETLIDVLGDVQERRDIAGACSQNSGSTLLSCSTARLLEIPGTSSCVQSENFFCVTQGSSSPIAIPLEELAKSIRELSDTLGNVANTAGSSSCANTTFTCPDGGSVCSVGTGICSDRSPNIKGCPAELVEKREGVRAWADQLSGTASELQAAITSANEDGELSILLGGEITILTCQGAQELVDGIITNEDGYKNGTCIEGTACCPDQNAIDAVASCEDINLFSC